MLEEDFAVHLDGLRHAEPEAISWMFTAFRDDVERCFRQRPPEDRADLVQDVFVTAITRLHTFQGDRAAVLRAWLKSIAFHRWHHRWEADLVRQRHAGVALEVLLELHPSHPAFSDERADPALTAIDRDVVGGLLGCLTPGQAKAVRAHVIEGKSTQQIAADWGVPRERVRGLYKRGMTRLRGSALTRSLVSAT